jgi:tricarballylate dehydrogenase
MRIQGSPHDTGEVLMAALDLGAAGAGQWSGADVGSVDGTIPEFAPVHKPTRRAYDLGVTVNLYGRRFFDEGLGESDTRDTPWTVVAQPGGVVYQLVDRRGAAQLPPEYLDGAPGTVVQTVRDAAHAFAIDPDGLERTVAEFNAAVLDPDRRRTLMPPRTGNAEPLREPPFTIYPVTAAITFTFGGLAVNSHAQVLNRRGEPLAGLYASGDVIGLYYHHHHLSASGQMRNVVFSRLAARHLGSG